MTQEELLTPFKKSGLTFYKDIGNFRYCPTGELYDIVTSTGIKITGVSEYADNTAAIAGGLTTGDVYRTGDLLKIVH